MTGDFMISEDEYEEPLIPTRWEEIEKLSKEDTKKILKNYKKILNGTYPLPEIPPVRPHKLKDSFRKEIK